MYVYIDIYIARLRLWSLRSHTWEVVLYKALSRLKRVYIAGTYAPQVWIEGTGLRGMGMILGRIVLFIGN